MYILRAYQSPCSGTHWAVQWAQMPNLASRNHSGHWYWASDSQLGSNLPVVIGSALGPADSCGFRASSPWTPPLSSKAVPNKPAVNSRRPDNAALCPEMLRTRFSPLYPAISSAPGRCAWDMECDF